MFVYNDMNTLKKKHAFPLPFRNHFNDWVIVTKGCK